MNWWKCHPRRSSSLDTHDVMCQVESMEHRACCLAVCLSLSISLLICVCVCARDLSVSCSHSPLCAMQPLLFSLYSELATEMRGKRQSFGPGAAARHWSRLRGPRISIVMTSCSHCTLPAFSHRRFGAPACEWWRALFVSILKTVNYSCSFSCVWLLHHQKPPPYVPSLWHIISGDHHHTSLLSGTSFQPNVYGRGHRSCASGGTWRPGLFVSDLTQCPCSL